MALTGPIQMEKKKKKMHPKPPKVYVGAWLPASEASQGVSK